VGKVDGGVGHVAALNDDLVVVIVVAAAGPCRGRIQKRRRCARGRHELHPLRLRARVRVRNGVGVVVDDDLDPA
jgi:hypothetical protein